MNFTVEWWEWGSGIREAIQKFRELEALWFSWCKNGFYGVDISIYHNHLKMFVASALDSQMTMLSIWMENEEGNTVGKI